MASRSGFMASTKRRRVELACNFCRNRKTKCDGQRPSCSSCVRARALCTYEGVTRDGPGKDPVIQNIGSVRAEASVDNDSTCIPVTPPLPGAPNNMIPDCNNDRFSSGPVDEEAAVDTLATEAFGGHESPRDTGFFGPSSNHEHFRTLSHAFAQIARSRFALKRAQLESWSRQNEAMPPGNKEPPMPYSAFDPYGMPDEEHAMFLFERYLSTINLAMPFLNKATLLQDYRQALRLRPSQVRQSLRILFNIIWAHASSSLNRPESEVFYRSAVTLLDNLAIRQTSPELVQVFLLLTSFQQNQQRSVASWTYHALSVKAAFQLGLHSPTAYRSFNEDEKEHRKRLWFGVLLQDRILCISLGRPSLIPEKHNRVEPLRSSNASPLSLNLGWDEGIVFFKHKISICSIIHSAMEDLYDFNILSDSIPLDQLILARTRLHLQLFNWRASISPFSIVIAGDINGRTPTYYDLKRFDILLSVYYYRVSLLINRAVLTRFLTQFALTNEQAIPEPVLEAVNSIIINDQKSAIELQGIFTAICKDDFTFLYRYAAWWAANYSVFSTSLHLLGILILTLQFPTIKAHLDCAATRKALLQSLNTLQIIGKTSLISWKGRVCMMKYIEGYDILVNGEETILGSTQAVDTPTHTNIALSDGLNHHDNLTGPLIGSMSDFIANAANDFFSQCTDLDLLQDDYGSLRY